MNAPVSVNIPVPIIRPECCAKCKFSVPVSGQPQPECRRMPPTVTAFQNARGIMNYTSFPRVMPDYWCGEWKPKIAIQQG